MISIESAIPRKACIHSEGGKRCFLLLSFLKRWRKDKSQRKEEEEEDKEGDEDTRKISSKTKAKQPEMKKIQLFPLERRLKLQD